MRFSEFTRHLRENKSTPDPILADLKMFLSQEAAEFQDDPDQKPQVSMDAIVNAMQNLGHAGFSADTLQAYFDDADTGLNNVLDAVSQDSVTLSTGVARMPDSRYC
jgi:hypothetical protein